MKKISKKVREIIVRGLKCGESHRVLGTRLGIHHSTVGKVRSELSSDGLKLPSGKNGRPSLLSVRGKRKIARLATTGTVTTATRIQQVLQDDISMPPFSVSTCRRALYEAGLNGRVKTKKPLLTRVHRKKRRAFVRAYRNWKIEDWQRVIWSDETKFNVFGSDGREYCWKRAGEPLRNHHVKPTIKHGKGSVTIWGCMAWSGVGFLCKIEGNMDGELYRSILEGELVQTIEWYGLEKANVVFQHDNDPKHTAYATKLWLEKNKFSVLVWPPQSPDMNPIEHMWNELERCIRKRRNIPKSTNELWLAIEKEWETISIPFCQKLISTIPKRIDDLKKAKGGFTRW